MGIFLCPHCDEADGLFNEDHVCSPDVLKEKIERLEQQNSQNYLNADRYAGAINRFVKNVQLFGYSDERMEELKKDVLPDTYKEDGEFCSPAHRNVVEDGAYLHVLSAALDFFKDKAVEEWYAYRNFKTLQDAISQLYKEVLKAVELLRWNDVKVYAPSDKNNLLYSEYQKHNIK